MSIPQVLNFSTLKRLTSNTESDTLVRDRFSSAEGWADTDIDSLTGGWIQYGGSFWRAKCQPSSQKIRKNSLVLIIGRRKNTLFVEELSFRTAP